MREAGFGREPRAALAQRQQWSVEQELARQGKDRIICRAIGSFVEQESQLRVSREAIRSRRRSAGGQADPLAEDEDEGLGPRPQSYLHATAGYSSGPATLAWPGGRDSGLSASPGSALAV